MIAGILVWVGLVAFMLGSMYAAMRMLARDDMPLTDLPAGERERISREKRVSRGTGASSATTRPAVSLPGPNAPRNPRHDRAGESGGGGSARSSSAAGQSTYQVLYAMAAALNEAWLDRLFSDPGAHRA